MYYIKITVLIHGESAHGSTPHLAKDAIVAASSFILNVQTLVSRMNNSLYPAVFTVSGVNAGTQFNIITDLVKMTAYLYAATPQMIEELQAKLLNIAQSSAAVYGCTAQLEVSGIQNSERGAEQ